MGEYDDMNDGRAHGFGGSASDSWMSSSSSERDSEQACDVVNYYFPVEIVVTGGLTPADHETIQANIFQDLYDAINRQLV